MKKSYINLTIALGLILLAVGIRLLSHPANFAPIAAVAIFGGSVLPKRIAVWTPVLAMIASDLIIGLHNLILVTWGCYALIALASYYALRKPSIKKGIALTFGSSIFFFGVTNFAVWVWSGMYAHSWLGLSQCFTMALPFFRNTAMSDLLYTGALFGVYALGLRYSRSLSSEAAVKN